MVTANDIDALLPQTQCGECGFPGCMPYAEALAAGEAPIDRCPPGGVLTLKALGTLLNINPEPYLMEAAQKTRPPSTAIIREAECIGCTKCIQACPVDAIIGSAKTMHTILSQECTGCGLCVEPCPVDCIDMVALDSFTFNKETARNRFKAKKERALSHAQDEIARYEAKRLLARQTLERLQAKNKP